MTLLASNSLIKVTPGLKIVHIISPGVTLISELEASSVI